MIIKIPSKKIPSLDEIRKRLSEYEIVFSESAVSSNYIRFKHSNGTDIFKEGEFIYSCRSGSFHFQFNSSGALFDLFSEFDDKTPEFIHHLIKDFPGSNYLPDRELLQELSKTSLIENNKFLEGLNPFQPVIIEVN